MIDFLYSKHFYNDIDTISNLITNLEYEDILYGKEVKDFQYIPEGLQDNFQSLLNYSIEIQEDSGIFRKPTNLVYFDNFYEHTLWICYVALEDTYCKIYNHTSGVSNFFEIPKEKEPSQFFLENSYKEENWNLINTINIAKNDFILIRPWLWKSFEADKCIQMFTLNKRL